MKSDASIRLEHRLTAVYLYVWQILEIPFPQFLGILKDNRDPNAAKIDVQLLPRPQKLLEFSFFVRQYISRSRLGKRVTSWDSSANR